MTKLQKAGLLAEEGDSFEVSPVLRLMVTPDTAREFISLYRQAGADVPEDAQTQQEEAATEDDN